MIMQIHVYELSVPPKANGFGSVFGRLVDIRQGQKQEREHTGIIEDPALGPVLDDHRQGSHSLVDLDIELDHASILQRQGVVDIHVTGEAEFGIPEFHDRHLCPGDTNDTFHTIWWRSAVAGRGVREDFIQRTFVESLGQQADLLELLQRCGDTEIH